MFAILTSKTMKVSIVTESVFSAHEFDVPTYFLRDSSQKSADFGKGSSPVFVFGRLSDLPEAINAVKAAVKKGVIRSEYGFVNDVWLRVDDGFAERLGADVFEVAYRRTNP